MVTRLASPWFRDFVTLRDAVDRLFEESFVDPARVLTIGGGTRAMPMEIYETPENVTVKALVPGVAPDDLDVTVQDGMLTIKAKSETPQASDDWAWHAREIGYGEYSRSVSLPTKVDIDQAESRLENGILTLTLPKAAESRPARIEIKPAAKLTAGT